MDAAQLTYRMNRVQVNALLVAGLGVAGCIAGALVDQTQMLTSYLFGFIFWINLSLGFLGILMLHHMTSGKWGFVLQRVAEAGTRTLPLMAILFVPLLLGVNKLYPWTQHGLEGHAVELKLAYLNIPFFAARAVLYFVIWIGGAFMLSSWSRRQDATADPRFTRSLRLLSAPGLVVYVLTVTFASVDWVMSLEPEWFSSIYGMMIVVGQVLGALALGIIVLRLIEKAPPLSNVVAPEHYLDMGNLVLAFVILWAYMSFSQFLITWAGNLPEEIPWYLKRLGEGWRILGLALIVMHFAVPFLLLLSRRTKKSSTKLAIIAAGLLVMRVIDVYWVVVPGTGRGGWSSAWMDLAAFAAVGGLWTILFVRQIAAQPLLPMHDPRFAMVREAQGHT